MIGEEQMRVDIYRIFLFGVLLSLFTSFLLSSTPAMIGLGFVPMPYGIQIPPKGSPFVDPDYGTTIVRITDKTIDKYSGLGIENEYAKVDPENSDGTLVVLRGNDGEWYLYDTKTYQMMKHLADIVGGEEPEPRWNRYDPTVFYFLYGMELRAYNVDTGVSVVVHDFKADFPLASYITTKSEGDASVDGRYWSFMVEDSSYDVLRVITYDRTSDTILGQKESFPDEVNWVSMDMSGNHCVVGYDGHIAQVFSLDFSVVMDLPEGANGHMDFALTSDGRDVLVYQNTATDWIAMADLNTGVETPLLWIPFTVNPDIGLHISGNSADKPGWVLVSTYGSMVPPLRSRHSWMDNLLFMLELKSNPTVVKIARTCSYTSIPYRERKNYFAEAFAAINTRGTKVYFGSNWGRTFKHDYTDTYVVMLPIAL